MNCTIPGYHFVKTEAIAEGLSGDRKFYAETADGARFLLRLCDAEEAERKKAVFARMQKIIACGIPMPTPLGFGLCSDGNTFYTQLTWVDGETVEKVLPRVLPPEQYRLGREAGKILRKIHSVPSAECRGDWSARYWDVIAPRLAAYSEKGIPFDGNESILHYLETNRTLLEARPQTLHHGDFHSGNLLLGRDGMLSVIDWDSADFDNIGDPWYEFCRVGGMYPAFASGQIDGYFGGAVPERFWKLFAFYISAGAITSIVWAKYRAPEYLDEIMQLNRDVVRAFDGMKKTVPDWYGKLDFPSQTW